MVEERRESGKAGDKGRKKGEGARGGGRKKEKEKGGRKERKRGEEEERKRGEEEER